MAESEAKPSKSKGRVQRGFTTGNSAAQRSQLIKRNFSISCEAYFFNRSISELLVGSDRSQFHSAVAKFIPFCSSLGTVDFSDDTDCYFGRPSDDQEQDI